MTDIGPTKEPPSHDEVAGRALEIAARRGGSHGYELDDFRQAERELRIERGLAAPKSRVGRDER